MITIGPYIAERTVTQFTTKVTLNVDMSADLTRHAEERKYRHGEEITDAEIRATVVKATEDIVQAYMDGTISDGEKITIYDPENDHLNLVCTFHMRDRVPEKLNIITIMRTPDFKSGDIKKRFKV